MSMNAKIIVLVSFLSFAISAMDNQRMFCKYKTKTVLNRTLHTAVCVQGLEPYPGTQPNPQCVHITNPGYPKNLIPTTEYKSYCPKHHLPYLNKK